MNSRVILLPFLARLARDTEPHSASSEARPITDQHRRTIGFLEVATNAARGTMEMLADESTR